MVDLRQTEKYVDYMRSIGWTVERIDNVNYFIRPFPLLGSFMKVQRPEKVDFKSLEKLQKKYRVFQTVIEPKGVSQQSSITSHGYKVTGPYLPSKTIHIDLTKSTNPLLKEMHYKTRYNIKQALKHYIAVEESKDIDAFARLWKNVKFNRKFMGTRDISELYKAFGNDAYLLMAFKDTELLGGVVCIHADKLAYYMYAATTLKGKKLYAPTLLAWEQIRLAQQKGCNIFEFEGIYDERFPIDSWKGFSRFKKGFGGKEVEYPGAFSKVKLLRGHGEDKG